MKLKSIQADKNSKMIMVAYDMPQVKAVLNIAYQIADNGTHTVKPEPQDQGRCRCARDAALRYGDEPAFTRWTRASGSDAVLSRITATASTHRTWASTLPTADEMFFPYVRPQETGTMGDIRWWNQSDNNGAGLRVEADKLFSASALHYNISDLDEGEEKDQRHSPSVPKSKFTNLCIDLKQAGVGGVDSWGESGRARKGYRVSIRLRLHVQHQPEIAVLIAVRRVRKQKLFFLWFPVSRIPDNFCFDTAPRLTQIGHQIFALFRLLFRAACNARVEGIAGYVETRTAAR